MSDGPNLLPKYQKMLDDGEYENIEELCNQEGLNYGDVFEDARDDEDSE